MSERPGSLSDGMDPAALAIHSKAGLARDVEFQRPLHLAIGMFDGVHIGHQAVIGQAMTAASVVPGHASGVLTFDPHPSRILHPTSATRLIFPLENRIRQMHQIGVDCVFVQPFTREYGSHEAEEFVPALLDLFPNLKSLHVGENFRFGARRSGGVDTLRTTSEAAGVELHAVRREIMEGEPISSSRIRGELVQGGIRNANLMLGRPYIIEGTVAPGRGIGKGMGFPTLNISWKPEVLPRFGVYRVWLRLPGNDTVLKGVANYGLHPTVGVGPDPLLEVHLLESGTIPGDGEVVRVALMDFLREEQTFPSVEALRVQIGQDVERVKESGPGQGEATGWGF